jgi:hypothetical protein
MKVIPYPYAVNLARFSRDKKNQRLFMVYQTWNMIQETQYSIYP